MMMMAKVVVVAEVAVIMVVMMMVLLVTTHPIMTPLIMIPLKKPIHLMKRHNSSVLWKPFSNQL
jgi:hypothetical protein